MSVVRKPIGHSLRFDVLEDRTVPATASFSNGALVVVAGANETINVAPIANQANGHITVTANGSTVFSSDVTNKIVRNLHIRFNEAQVGTLNVFSGTGVDGQFKVTGALSRSDINVQGALWVGRDFIFQGAREGANDTIFTGTNLHVGRNASFALGGGTNSLTLGGGKITGQLNVTGGNGNDTVSISTGGQQALAAEMGINGMATLTLGDGTNSFLSDGTLLTRIGRSFNYYGGQHADVIDFHDESLNPTILIGRHFTAYLGRSAGSSNRVELDDVTIGRSATIVGGINTDFVQLHGTAAIGGSFALRLRGGANTAILGFDLKPVTVGGNLSYNGWEGDDAVTLGTTIVTRNLRVALGRANGLNQRLDVGSGIPIVDSFGALIVPTVSVGGNTVLTGGNGIDRIHVDYFNCQGSLRISTGAGDDEVVTTEIVVLRKSVMHLGSGNDVWIADPAMTNVIQKYIKGIGLDLPLVQSLLSYLQSHTLSPDALGDLVEQLMILDITPTGLLALANDLSPLGLNVEELESLVADLSSTSVQNLISQLSTLDLPAAELTTLLNDVVAQDVAKLETDVRKLLTGTPNEGLIETLQTTLLAIGVSNLLNDAEDLGISTDQVADLLNDLSTLDLTVPDLNVLLQQISNLALGSDATAEVLSLLSKFELISLPIPTLPLGQVLQTLDISRPTHSRLERLRFFGAAGEDRVTLGESLSQMTFLGRVVLQGGREIDTLSVAKNNYLGTNNREDFEIGSL